MNCKVKCFIFSCSFLLCALSHEAYTQPNTIIFDQYETEDGLPLLGVYCIHQDPYGFLWFGTDLGLARFDGYTFKLYNHIPGDSTSLSNNSIRAVLEDKNGFLWVGTDGGGLNRFDYQTETFRRFKNDPKDSFSIGSNRVYSLSLDKNERLWIGTFGKGLNVVDTKNKKNLEYKFRRLPSVEDQSDALNDNNIWTLMIDKNNNLWVGTVAGGINILDLSTFDFSAPDSDISFNHIISEPNNKQSISDNYIMSIFQDQMENIWVGTGHGGLNKFNSNFELIKRFDGEFKEFSTNNQISSILQDSQGRLWIGTNGEGIGLYNDAKETFKFYKKQTGTANALNTDFIFSIYEDSSGIIWLGTKQGGVNLINPLWQQFGYFSDFGPLNPKQGALLKTIIEASNGDIWIGSFNGGIVQLKGATREVVNVYDNIGQKEKVTYNNVQSLLDDGEYLWIGTDGNGLARLNKVTGRISYFDYGEASQESIHGSRVWALLKNSNEGIWIGVADGGGLNYFDFVSESFMHYLHDPEDSSSLSNNDVRILFEDRLGELWIGTQGGGLNRLSRNNGTFERFQANEKDSTSISSNYVTCIYESRQTGDLWIGTFGGGLNRYDRSKKAFESFTSSDGLLVDAVKSIEEDDNGNLWISTLKGISKFNPFTRVFNNFSDRHALRHQTFSQGTSCRDRKGFMYFGGFEGFSFFHPDSIVVDGRTRPVAITEIEASNQTLEIGKKYHNNLILTKNLNELSEVIFPYQFNAFTLNFSALYFEDPYRVSYQYYLQDFDDNWIGTSATRRFANYTNIPPGRYIFRVRSIIDGVPSDEIKELTIELQYPPWQSWWAYLIYSIGLVFLFYFIKILLSLRQEKSLNKLKLQFFMNVSHEFRTPLTLILGPLESLLQEESNLSQKGHRQVQLIQRNSKRLLNLINQLLDLRKSESGMKSIVRENQDIVDFVKEITLLFDPVAKKLDLNIEFFSAQKRMNMIFDPFEMEKVISNLISNACKHTPKKGEILVGVDQHFRAGQQFVLISIQDSGEGIPSEDLSKIFDRFNTLSSKIGRDELSTGLGLHLSRDIVELHGGSIKVESEIGKGSRFIIELPLMTDSEVGDENHEHISSMYGLESSPVQVEQSHRDEEGKKFKILIVEDEDDVQNYLKDLLGDNYLLDMASDGQEGLEKSLDTPDLIISDIMMPNMDGIEFCKRIKTNLETSHIPIVLLTSLNTAANKMEGFETGADAYVTKPFSPGLLLSQVKTLIELREHLKEKFRGASVLEPSEVALTTRDEQLLKDAMTVMEEHMSDPDLDVSMLAKEVGLGRTQLFKKIHALTGHTPNEFIVQIRMKRASQLFKSNPDLSVSEVSYKVGFSTPRYFTKCFKDHFNVTPSMFSDNLKPDNKGTVF